MRTRTRLVAGVALVLWAAMLLIAAGVSAAPCDDDRCSPDCGDCTSCMPVLNLDPPAGVTSVASPSASLSPVSVGAASRPPRPVEHVPLRLAS